MRAGTDATDQPVTDVPGERAATGLRGSMADVEHDATPWRRRLIARSLAFLYMTGPTLVVAWLVLPHDPRANEAVLVGLAIGSFAIGILLMGQVFERLPLWVLKAVVAVATVLVSLVLYVSALGSDFTFFYIWTTAYAYCFFSRRHALGQTALAAACAAATILLQGNPYALPARLLAGQGAFQWLMVVGTAVVVGVLVRRLTESLRESERRFGKCIQDASVGMALVSCDWRWLHVNEALCAMLARGAGDLVGRSVGEVTHPDDPLPSGERVREARRDGRPAFAFEKRYLRPDGEVVWVDVLSTLIEDDDGRPQYFFTQLLDITARKGAEAERQRAGALLAQRAAEQEAVALLGQRALKTADLSTLMHDAARVAAETLGAGLCGVFELLTDQDELRLLAGVGFSADLVGRATVSARSDCHAGYTLQAEHAVVVSDLESDPRFEGPDLLLEQGVVSGMSVPVSGRQRPFGVLGVYTREAHGFSSDDANFLTSVANVLATAIERVSSEETTRHQALHDALTGLPNRVLFLDRLGHALRRSERDGERIAVMLLDIDEFKVINDSLGHQAGDELLVLLAPRLYDALRPGDTVARLGGDEFVLLCENVGSEHDALALAHRLSSAWARPFELEAAEVYVTGSTGIALSPTSGGDAAALLREADAAMYRAKDHGHGHVELFDEDMRALAFERLRTENDLRRALHRGELRLAYQPIVDLADGRPLGVEALVRWDHPDRGTVAPGDFIPQTEETGLILSIGRWVLEEACLQAARWRRELPGEHPLELSVNLSGRQVGREDLAADVDRILEESGLPPESLSLEITESSLMQEADHHRSTLAKLKALGLGLALDDFGTGYSSLSYLQRLPLDTLKLDRSFVMGLGAGNGDGGGEGAIVAAVVSMARSLGLTVVAEGVETEEQASHLRELGCARAQGYYFARPLAPEDVGPLFAAWRAAEGNGDRATVRLGSISDLRARN